MLEFQLSIIFFTGSGPSCTETSNLCQWNPVDGGPSILKSAPNCNITFCVKNVVIKAPVNVQVQTIRKTLRTS